MFAWTLATVVQLSLAATGSDSYAEAHHTVVETGKPMVVMVGTTWCGPCQRMKREVLPRLRQRPIFKRVAFATIDPDQDSKLARQITGGGPVPQLVMFRKTRNGWMRRKIIGSQSLETVEKFIEQGVELDRMAKGKGKKSEQEVRRQPREKDHADNRRKADNQQTAVSTVSAG